MSHITHLPPTSTLFPYTTLFRSSFDGRRGDLWPGQHGRRRDGGGAHPHPGSAREAAQSRRPRAHAGTEQHPRRSEEHTSELQSQSNLVCRLLLEKKNEKCKHQAE